MERIHSLVDKLYQQKQENASPAHLLFTAQLLQAELLKLQNKNGSLSTSKVAVTLPVNLSFTEDVVKAALDNADSEAFGKKAEPPIKRQEEVKPQTETFFQRQEYALRKPVVEEQKPAQKEERKPVEEKKPAYVQPQLMNPAFDAVAEAPTLNQYDVHKPVGVAERKKEIFELVMPKEVHELLGEQKESLNDRLKEEKTELAHVLTGGPIKDLRKAIGINDRFTLIRELFRGDEAMYERSIKTINNFNIFSEAEYWISRELKYKLGWIDNNPTVQYFYQLVRRRFS